MDLDTQTRYYLPQDISTNIRVWWAQNLLPGRPNDPQDWLESYRDWLKTQQVYIEECPGSDPIEYFYYRLWTPDHRRPTLLMLKYLHV